MIASSVSSVPVLLLTFSLFSISVQSRQLATVPNGFVQIGQTLVGANNSGSGNVEFGTAIALSDTGFRLAIGARGHDWSNADSTGTVINNAGAVFVHDWNATTSSWDLKTFFVGVAGQQMGRWVSMSSDGSLIAIRRGVTGASEVWKVDEAGAKTQLGHGITCNDSGGMLALSPNGKRLAVSCGGNVGLVKIFDWNNSANTWDPIGTLTAPSPTNSSAAGQFGFDIAFSMDGHRIAVSAPNFQGSLMEQGLVRVFDFNATNWNQVGPDLLGNATSQKFGFAMDISSDGNTLVVGSPNKYMVGGAATGAVEVFKLSGGKWISQYEYEGEGADDRLGRGIAVTRHGDQFVVSSVGHNEARGQVLIFRLSGTTWSRVAEFEGLSAGDRLGGTMNMGVAMTDDGSLLAAASITAQTNGIVQVFDDISTLSPSAIVADPEQFQWDIARVGSVQLSFTEEAGTSEIVLSYNISLRNYKIQVFEDDCVTPAPPDVTNVTSELIIATTTHGDLSVNVDLKQDAIINSDLWNGTGIGEGYISMCIRVDLLLGDLAETSVTFHEQKLFVTISLIQGFEVTGIDLDRLEADEEDGNVTSNYTLSACQCDESFTCVNTILTQGSDVYICVETTAPNMEIAQVRELRFTQGVFSVSPVVDGVADALSKVFYAGKEVSIRYQMISTFFEDPNPADVIASGSVLLAFTDESRRRQLRLVKLVPRALQKKTEEDVFKVTMTLAASDASAGTALRGFVSVAVGIVIAVVGAIALAK